MTSYENLQLNFIVWCSEPRTLLNVMSISIQSLSLEGLTGLSVTSECEFYNLPDKNNAAEDHDIN